jgi:hypothetical protein
MGLYTNRSATIKENTSTSEIEAYIESSFIFLDESSTTASVKKEIKELKDKKSITDTDIKKIVKDINDIDDSKSKSALVITLIVSILGYAIGAGALVSAGKVTVDTIKIITTLLTAIAGIGVHITDKDKVISIYSKIVKMEGEANAKLKKLKLLSANEDKDKQKEIKEYEKYIDALEKLRKEYRNYQTAKTLGEVKESYIIEFKGNAAKTESLKLIIDEISSICEANYEKIKSIDKAISDMEAIFNSALKMKSNEKIYSEINKIRDIGVKENKEIKNIRAKYGVNGNITFKMFKKDFKSFTAKYSEVTMQDKKALYEKLSKFEKEIYNLGNKCSTVTRKDVYIMKENAIKTGKTQLNDTISTIIEWGDYLIDEVNGALGDIRYIKQDLHVEGENSFVYKILNPIKKDK